MDRITVRSYGALGRVVIVLLQTVRSDGANALIDLMVNGVPIETRYCVHKQKDLICRKY